MTIPDDAGSLVPNDPPRGLSTRGLKAALKVAARERLSADELALARATHPCLKSVSDEAVRLAARHPPLWEYRLYFQALAEFIARESAAVEAASRRPAEQTAHPDIRTALAWIRARQADYLGLAPQVEALVNAELQVAFGAPGEPGDVAAIVLVAGKLARVYRRFLDLRAAAQSQRVDPVFAEVMREFSRIGDQSIAEFERYPKASLATIETALANDDGQTELVLDLQLKLTADTDGLHAALDRAHRRLFGVPLGEHVSSGPDPFDFAALGDTEMLPSHLPLAALETLIRDHCRLTKSESDEYTPLEMLTGYYEDGEYGGMPIGNPESDETDPLARLQSGERLAIQLHLGVIQSESQFIDGKPYAATDDEITADEEGIDDAAAFPDETGFFGLGIWLDGDQLGLEPLRISGDFNGNICVTRAAFPASLVERTSRYLARVEGQSS
jgi:hypothetical protein